MRWRRLSKFPQQAEAPHRKSTNQPDATKRVPPILKHARRPLRWRYLKIFDRAILHAGFDGHRAAADLAVHNELRGFIKIQLALEVLLAMRAGDGDEHGDQIDMPRSVQPFAANATVLLFPAATGRKPKIFQHPPCSPTPCWLHGLPVDCCPICNDSLPISLNAARW